MRLSERIDQLWSHHSELAVGTSGRAMKEQEPCTLHVGHCGDCVQQELLFGLNLLQQQTHVLVVAHRCAQNLDTLYGKRHL